ncbi:MAG: hypothetical protein DID92_2727743056 [Candidatus Nitrotoga sp. SPKER]|nr:MAG: hypothetical protein DID92_2727743056 [Candidatus Nitrotoga sp. SPKER]
MQGFLAGHIAQVEPVGEAVLRSICSSLTGGWPLLALGWYGSINTHSSAYGIIVSIRSRQKFQLARQTRVFLKSPRSHAHLFYVRLHPDNFIQSNYDMQLP